MNGPGGPQHRQQQLTCLNTDCLTILATYLDGADFCRLLASSRTLAQAAADARLNLAEADNSRKLYALHFWAVNEQRTRNSQNALQQLLPHFASCFRTEAVLQPAGAAAQQQQPAQQPQPAQQQQQQQPNHQQQNGKPQDAQQQQQQQPPLREKLQVLSAAALIGGWWQPTAESDGGAAQQLALQALGECFGQSVADCVKAVVSDARCPAAARGFWGCIFLGLILSTCVEVPNKAQARPVRSLLHIGQPDSLFPSTSSIPVICPLTGAGTTEDPGRVECCWQAAALPHYVRYHAKQFVCAFVVLVRAMVQRPTVAHVEDKASLKQLHFDLQTVLIKLHNDEEDAATAAAQGQPDEAVWQIPNPAILPAAGLPATTVLTSEQFRMCNNAIPENPREAQLIITVNALAGSGKSSSLRLLQLLHPGKTILYTAYNKLVIEDMKKSMITAYARLGWPTRHDGLPLNVDHLTTHVIATEAYWEYKNTPGWNIGGVKGDMLVPHLNMLGFFRLRQQQRERGAASFGMGWLVKDTLQAFCTSMDERILPTHLPIHRLKPSTMKYEGLTADEAVLAAQQLWDAFIAKRFTRFIVDFNWYLKAFVLKVVRTGRQLTASNGKPYDIILVDEAQDVNPVTYQLLMSQQCTIMFVGDRRQHIYGFNNAMDALSEAAAEPHRRKKAYTLSHSFRLGDMVAEVANMVLHELGENRQTMIAAGRPQASVYIMPEEPPALQVPAPAPAADANADSDDSDGDVDGDDNTAHDGPAAEEAAAAAEEAAAEAAAAAAHAAEEAAADAHQQWLQDNPPYQQLQLLGDPVPPTESTPVQLTAVRINIMELKRQMRPGFGGMLIVDDEAMPVLMEGHPLFFAVPPRKPAPHSDRVQPLMFLSRTNAYWFQVAAGLALQTGAPGRGIRAILGRAPRLYLMAGKQGQANEGSQVQQTVNVEFFQKVQNVYNFRYLDCAVDSDNPLRRRYTDYESMRTDVLGKKDDVEFKAPITICDIYGPRTQDVLDAIHSVTVTRREDADFMLGTCHKGKGQEEMYAQLADDFAELGRPGAFVAPDGDELNLVYVAITRAMLGLVCNRNIALLLTEKSRKRLQVEARPSHPDEQEQQQQQQQVGCGCCHFQFDPAAAVSATVGHLAVNFIRADDLPGQSRVMCRECVRNTLLGQLVSG